LIRIDNSLLIGASGFLGTSLAESIGFSDLVTSKSAMGEGEYDLIVCAAPSGKKWQANKYPDQDLLEVKQLITRLKLLKAKKFILLSTVDVYQNVEDSDEDSALCSSENAYGYNRRLIEEVVSEEYSEHLILRLSGLVGLKLKKNPVYDIKNNNQLDKLNKKSNMQFLPVAKIAEIISGSVSDMSGTVNVTAEPLSLADIAKSRSIVLSDSGKEVHYNVKSKSPYTVNNSGYFCTKKESIDAIKEYFRS
jgi:dTDP-4-dehydrorhamnose reductase